MLEGAQPTISKIPLGYKQHYIAPQSYKPSELDNQHRDFVTNHFATEVAVHEQFRAKTPESAMAQLGEELCETGAAIFKTFRFGPDSTNPLLPPSKQESNLAWIKREILDVEAAITEFRRHWGP